MGLSRQEHWSGLPFPPPMRESEVAQSCLTLSNPMDCSPPGSSIHGIFRATVLEWGAIAFSIRCNSDAIYVYVYLCVLCIFMVSQVQVPFVLLNIALLVLAHGIK